MLLIKHQTKNEKFRQRASCLRPLRTKRDAALAAALGLAPLLVGMKSVAYGVSSGGVDDGILLKEDCMLSRSQVRKSGRLIGSRVIGYGTIL